MSGQQRRQPCAGGAARLFDAPPPHAHTHARPALAACFFSPARAARAHEPMAQAESSACTRCGEPGHLARSCKLPRICEKCGVVGHSGDRCGALARAGGAPGARPAARPFRGGARARASLNPARFSAAACAAAGREVPGAAQAQPRQPRRLHLPQVRAGAAAAPLAKETGGHSTRAPLARCPRAVLCPRKRVSTGGSPAAHRCGNKGHIKRECRTYAPSCTICAKVGHTFTNCPRSGGSAHAIVARRSNEAAIFQAQKAVRARAPVVARSVTRGAGGANRAAGRLPN